jgi:hypothetical protein
VSTLPQSEPDLISYGSGTELSRRDTRRRDATAYAAWNYALPADVKADLDAWDKAPAPGWTE